MILNPTVKNEHGVLDIFSLNLENRIVLMTGEITDEMSASIISQLLYLDSVEKTPISLYINSPGGSVSAGFAIYDTMKSLRSDVFTICLGRAASMAAVILSGGTKYRRKILPHGEVMIHQPSGGIDGQASDILIASKHIESVRADLNELLAANCGKDLEEVASATDRDHWMKPEEAIAFGLVDGILG